jgi:hypothetical protein
METAVAVEVSAVEVRDRLLGFVEGVAARLPLRPATRERAGVRARADRAGRPQELAADAVSAGGVELPFVASDLPRVAPGCDRSAPQMLHPGRLRRPAAEPSRLPLTDRGRWHPQRPDARRPYRRLHPLRARLRRPPRRLDLRRHRCRSRVRGHVHPPRSARGRGATGIRSRDLPQPPRRLPRRRVRLARPAGRVRRHPPPGARRERVTPIQGRAVCRPRPPLNEGGGQ